MPARIAVALGLLLSILLLGPTRAQVHVARAGGYEVRGNVIAADALPAETAGRYDIRRAPNVGVLNVVVLHGTDAAREPVRADVEAWLKALTGVERRIEMRPTVANDRVSYLGTFTIPARRSELEFRVVARPHGGGDPVALRFSDVLVIGRP